MQDECGVIYMHTGDYYYRVLYFTILQSIYSTRSSILHRQVSTLGVASAVTVETTADPSHRQKDKHDSPQRSPSVPQM